MFGIKLETPFIITLEMEGKVFVGEGATALEALRAVKAPQKITVKGVITVTHGDKKSRRLLTPIRLKRFFYPNAQRVLVKQLVVGMK